MNNKKIEFMITLISIIIVILAIVIPSIKVVINILVIIVLLFFNFASSKLLKLSNDNPKIKTMKRIVILSIILILFFLYINYSKIIDLSGLSFQYWFIIGIMIITGNIAPKIPQNRYFGYRLPWTIRNKNSWRVAHKVLGYSAFILVISMTVLLYFGVREGTIIKYGFALWIILPGVYSLKVYLKEKEKIVMIREIIKEFLGENLSKQNKKCVKVNAVTIVLMFIVSFAMLFFLPKEIPIIHEGDINYPIPTILGIWLVPLLACVMNFTFIRQKRMNIINSISLIAMLMLSTYYYFTLI